MAAANCAAANIGAAYGVLSLLMEFSLVYQQPQRIQRDDPWRNSVRGAPLPRIYSRCGGILVACRMLAEMKARAGTYRAGSFVLLPAPAFG